MLGLLDKMEFTRLRGPAAAGVTDITDSNALDCRNFEVFGFVVGFGALTNGGTFAVEIHGSTNDGTSYSLVKDQEGNDCRVAVADDQDNKIVVIEVVRPYGSVDKLKPVIKRSGQNGVVDFVLGYRGCGRTIPTSQPDTVASATRFVSPSVP
mgnify:CR=1 FL=1